MKNTNSALLGSLIFLVAEISLGQDALTLICQDRNPQYQMVINLDMTNKRVLINESFDNYVDDDQISFKQRIGDNIHKTIIYRATGAYTVFVTGKHNFTFGGTCQKKTSNKF